MTQDLKTAIFVTAVLLIGLSQAGALTTPKATAKGALLPQDKPSRAAKHKNAARTKTPAVPAQPWQRLAIQSGDGLSTVLDRAGLADDVWSKVLALGAAVQPLLQLQPGDSLYIRQSPRGHLTALLYHLDANTALVVEQQHGIWTTHTGATQLHTVERMISGHAGDSLARALRAAGLNASLAARVTGIFKWRVDLERQLRGGDYFAVLYKQRYLDGHRLPGGTILAVQLQVDNHTLRAFRHKDSDGQVHYYDLGGHSYEYSIERTPLDYVYVSSPFSYHRMNPVLHIMRPHLGVDLAANTGTPVHAAASGQVVFHGRDGGYGRLIEINHPNGYQTRYAHLSAYAKGLHDGEYVHKDQLIGYVGESGVATGPHLHYEIRRNGVAHDPLHMPLPQGHQLKGKVLARFRQRIRPQVARLNHNWPAPLRGKLAMAQPTQGACFFSHATNTRADALQQLLCSAY